MILIFQIFAITDPQTGTAAATGGTTNGNRLKLTISNRECNRSFINAKNYQS